MLLLRLPSLFSLIALASTALASSSPHSGADFALVRRASSTTVKTVAAELTSEIEAAATKVKSLTKSVASSAAKVQKVLKSNGSDLHKAGTSLGYASQADLTVLTTLDSSLQNVHNAVYNLGKLTAALESSTGSVDFTAAKSSTAVTTVSDALETLTTQLHLTLKPYLVLASSSSTFSGLYKQAVFGTAMQLTAITMDLCALGEGKSGTLGQRLVGWFDDAGKEEGNIFYDLIELGILGK